MLANATNWDENAYKESIFKEIELQTRTVFRTIWAPSFNSSPDTIVVASSDGSLASYSISSCISNLHFGYSNTKSLLEPEPHCFLQGHDGPAYDVKFYEDGDNTLLLSGGDDGHIRGWRWRECTDVELPISSQGCHVEPVIDLMNPQYK